MQRNRSGKSGTISRSSKNTSSSSFSQTGRSAPSATASISTSRHLSSSSSGAIISASTTFSRAVTSNARQYGTSAVLARRALTASNSSPVSIPSRFVSKNTSKKLVNTKKRLMLEIPAPQEVKDMGVTDAVTSFEQPTKFATFHHAMPDINTTAHPLLAKPEIPHAEQMFAVIDINGFQYKVTKDDEVMVHHLRDVEIGEQLAFEHVHLLGSRDFTLLGKPYVPSVSVIASVEEHTMLAPVNVWRYKRRTGYRNLNRQRDHVTILRIDDIQLEDPSIIPQVEPLSHIPVLQVKPTAEQDAAPQESTA